MQKTQKTIIIEIDDPNEPAFKTVGKTRYGARIVKANRAAARKAAKRASLKRNKAEAA